MKNLLIAMVAILFSTNAAAQNQKKMNSGKTLVAYFSCTGTTKNAAQKITEAINADLFEIQPVQLYTSADLDWNNKSSRSSVEMNDPASRPAIANKVPAIDQYDLIFIGYPIWWDQAPRIINTFIESYDLKGKTVVPFATSGSSAISNSEKNLRSSYPQINWKSGKLLNGRVDKNSINGWLNGLN